MLRSFEMSHLYQVLKIRLTNRDFLAGPGKGVYGIADIYTFPWFVLFILGSEECS
jgi:hypothetical protein